MVATTRGSLRLLYYFGDRRHGGIRRGRSVSTRHMTMALMMALAERHPGRAFTIIVVLFAVAYVIAIAGEPGRTRPISQNGTTRSESQLVGYASRGAGAPAGAR